MISLHVRAGFVVVIDPLADDVIQVPLAEQNEFVQALIFDGLNDPFDAAVGLYRQLRLMGTLSHDVFA